MKSQKKIDVLYQELPEVFSLKDLPEIDDSEWVILSHDNLDWENLFKDFEELFLDYFNSVAQAYLPVSLPDLSDFMTLKKKPGSPVPIPKRGITPPPDALAFYLPFHEYYPDKWGIYILFEGIIILSQRLIDLCSKKNLPDIKLFPEIAIRALFYHEAYHNAVENFAVKLELTHKKKIYLTAFNDYYAKTSDTDDCLEEALANLNLIKNVFAYINDNKSIDVDKKKYLKAAFLSYIKDNPPGYRKSYDIYIIQHEQEHKLIFINELMNCALSPNYRSKEVWSLFSHAISPLIKIDQICYLINRKSEIWHIVPKHIKSIRYRELIKKLSKIDNIKLLRQGRGSHEIWISSKGKRFVIPRHKNDIPVGTIISIMRDLNLKMSFSEFLSV